MVGYIYLIGFILTSACVFGLVFVIGLKGARWWDYWGIGAGSLICGLTALWFIHLAVDLELSRGGF
jgi:hypothetical protein